MVELVDHRYGSEFQNLYDDFCRNACNFVQIDKYRRFWAHRNGTLSVIIVRDSTEVHARRLLAVPPSIAAAAQAGRLRVANGSRRLRRSTTTIRHCTPNGENCSGALKTRSGSFACSDGRLDTTLPTLELVRVSWHRDATNALSCVLMYKQTHNTTDSGATPLETIYNNRKVNRKDKTPAKPQQVVVSGAKEVEELYGLHLYVCYNCKRVLIKPLQCGGCKCAAYCSRVCITTTSADTVITHSPTHSRLYHI